MSLAQGRYDCPVCWKRVLVVAGFVRAHRDARFSEFIAKCPAGGQTPAEAEASVAGRPPAFPPQHRRGGGHDDRADSLPQ